MLTTSLRCVGAWLTSDFRPKPEGREWPTPLECLGCTCFVAGYFGLIAWMGEAAGF